MFEYLQFIFSGETLKNFPTNVDLTTVNVCFIICILPVIINFFQNVNILYVF
jgi:hypothetical protein